MKGVCLLCGEEAELSEEHIIPQCLGGILKTKIYCDFCNRKLGHEVDVTLAANFGRYATLLNVKRERGENQPYNIFDENTGIDLQFNGERLIRVKPVVRLNKDRTGKLEGVEIIARSKEERDKIFRGIAKKYNIDLSLVAFDEPEYGPPSSSYNFCIENESICKAIAKITFGFACWKLPSELMLSDSFSRMRKYLLGENEDKLVSANYIDTRFMSDNIRPLHKIHLGFNRSENIIIGFVAIFGVFKYTVLISDNYSSDIEWPAIDYTFNPVTRKEVPARLTFSAPKLSRDEVVNPKHSEAMVAAALKNGLNMIASNTNVLKSGVKVERIKA